MRGRYRHTRKTSGPDKQYGNFKSMFSFSPYSFLPMVEGVYIVYKILSPIKLVTFKIQDAKICHSNRLTVLFTVTPISTLSNVRNRV